MAEIVNLRTARKRFERAASEKAAAENRVRHGTSKSAKSKRATETERREKTLDGHRIGGSGPGSENGSGRAGDKTP